MQKANLNNGGGQICICDHKKWSTIGDNREVGQLRDVITLQHQIVIIKDKIRDHKKWST